MSVAGISHLLILLFYVCFVFMNHPVLEIDKPKLTWARENDLHEFTW